MFFDFDCNTLTEFFNFLFFFIGLVLVFFTGYLFRSIVSRRYNK